MALSHVEKLRVQRGAEHLHFLGPRAVAEILTELAIGLDGVDMLLRLVAEYKTLTSSLVRAAGGDRFPPRPLRQFV